MLKTTLLSMGLDQRIYNMLLLIGLWARRWPLDTSTSLQVICLL